MTRFRLAMFGHGIGRQSAEPKSKHHYSNTTVAAKATRSRCGEIVVWTTDCAPNVQRNKPKTSSENTCPRMCLCLCLCLCPCPCPCVHLFAVEKRGGRGKIPCCFPRTCVSLRSVQVNTGVNIDGVLEDSDLEDSDLEDSD